MHKTKAQYLRVVGVSIVLLGVIATAIYIVRRENLLKVSVIRPYRKDPSQAIVITDLRSIPAHLSLNVGESLLWENQTDDLTLQMLAKEFASPHLSPKESYQLQFEKTGKYMVEYRGLSDSEKQYFTEITIN